MNRALDGIRVVDLTVEFWGSIGAALLGDFGAEVIRVDDLEERGDRRRGGGRSAGRVERARRAGAAEQAEPRGRPRERARPAALVRRLVAKADVVVTDRRRGALAALGLDYATLVRVKPRPDLRAWLRLRSHRSGRRSPGDRRARRRPHRHDADPAAARTAAGLSGPRPDVHRRHARVRHPDGAPSPRTDRGGQEVDTSLLAGNMYGASLDLQAYLAIGGDAHAATDLAPRRREPDERHGLHERGRALGDAHHARHRPLVADLSPRSSSSRSTTRASTPTTSAAAPIASR